MRRRATHTGALDGDLSGLRLSPADERLAIANALVEDQPPGGLPPGPRLHPRGTLAHLKYEAFDGDGRRTAEWRVRALIPPLPAIEGGMADRATPLSADGCPSACQTSVTHAGGTLLGDSGSPGIGAEWVRRMPVGQSYDLGSRSLVTHDLLDPAPRQVPVSFRRVDGRSLPEPANIRDTRVDVCRATVLVGSSTASSSIPTPLFRFPVASEPFDGSS